MATYVFKATLQEEEDGRWSAWVDALPGCATWGYTREEALQALQEGTELYIECRLEYGDPIPIAEIEGFDSPTVTVTVEPVTA